MSKTYLLYELAATQGHAMAQQQLGAATELALTDKRHDAARGWLQLAAAQGEPTAMFQSWKMQPNDPASAPWLLEAAEAGLSAAACALGKASFVGEFGVQADPARSKLWLQRAAELGDKEATRLLEA